ncbi:unnamed protein product [Porites lobata]|uniref:ISXO2-like transposase domain-containing protein n=1 Tax=Porites lobata TaxID=104759 RepID=A0ABN8NTM3_9CNID|nr:unnamed protein product [Porites lobata]
MGKILLCIYLWSVCELCTTAANKLGLTKNTVGNVYALLRRYCGQDLQDRPVIPFGSHVHVAKCDVSQFKHKSKYHCGRRARDDVWVFGFISTEHSPCPGYFQIVPWCDRATLTPILSRVLLPGSEVHTNDWAAYRNLPAHVPNVSVHRSVMKIL